ncbi:hypothetical protein H4687_006069 [Streptomyces stelliscabiei]|uniref:Uncharacterized protein n=1 Tax=Streptomyces stelliscabiei TaxID=146820 RepID=A0A8I0PCJ3_9ACTN|nr:hypothetical protein [Streptomyces stelliscabiei]
MAPGCWSPAASGSSSSATACARTASGRSPATGRTRIGTARRSARPSRCRRRARRCSRPGSGSCRRSVSAWRQPSVSRSHAYRPARRGKLIGARSELTCSPRARGSAWRTRPTRTSRPISTSPSPSRGIATDLRLVMGDKAVRQPRTPRSRKIDMSRAARPYRRSVGSQIPWPNLTADGHSAADWPRFRDRMVALSHSSCRILPRCRSCWRILIAARAERRRLLRLRGSSCFSRPGLPPRHVRDFCESQVV